MTALLLYSFSYLWKPDELTQKFPSECLGQYFEENDPIESVCRRVTNENSYRFDVSQIHPIGFRSKDIYSDVKDWLNNYQDKNYWIMSEVDSVELTTDLELIGLKCSKYMLI